MPSRSKYHPLFEYLKEQPDTEIMELSFSEIEAILAKELPNTAKKTRAWWANSQTAQGKMWQEAGWLVDDVDFEAQYVVFRPARITYRVSPIRKSKGWSAAEIKALRQYAGWSQQELADKLGVRQQTVSDWELNIHTSRRSMGKLLQMVAENIGYTYQTTNKEDDAVEGAENSGSDQN